MTVQKTAVSSALYRLMTPLYGLEREQAVSPQALDTLLTQAKKKPQFGAAGAAVVQAAYDAAKAKSGANPTREALRAELQKAVSTLSNERGKGRINDGYVDAREAGLSSNPLVPLLYRFTDTSPDFARAKPQTPKSVSASFEAIAKAVRQLEPLVTKAFEAFKANPSEYEDDPANAFRAVAKDAGLSTAGRVTLLTALNGATTRSDGGRGPTAADVQQVLWNGLDKLKGADGAQIVDFDRPDAAPVSVKDGVVTALELQRTPSVQGKTSVALLEFAAQVQKEPKDDSPVRGVANTTSQALVKQHVDAYGASPVSFQDAFKRAVDALMTQKAGETPLAVFMEFGGRDGGSLSEAAAKKKLQAALAGLELLPVGEASESGGTPKDDWIFSVDVDSPTDHGFWVSVNRKTGEASVNGFN